MEEVLKSIAEGAAPGEAVGRVLGLPEKEQEELIEAAGRLKSENAARFLALIYPSLSDKRVRKLVKRGLFRLKTQGITVEEPRPPGEPALRKVETSREAKAYLSNYEDELTRLLLVACEVKKNRFVFSHVALHLYNGLLEMKSAPVTRGELDSLLEKYLASAITPMVLQPISVPYAGYLIEEASVLSGKEVEEARGMNRIFAGAKGGVRRPEDIYLLDDYGAVPASLEDVFAHEIFEPFRLSWPGIEEDKKRLDEAVNPSILLPPYIVEERRQAFLDGLAGDERPASKLPAFRRMLEDYAYLLYCLKKYDLYRGLIDRLKEQASIKKAFLHFVRKTFDKLKEGEERLPGVIVDPYSLKK